MGSTAYDGANGVGLGGKFKKRPFRKSHTTPYDRPTSSLRPTQINNINNGNNRNGWLSKIVDPASRIITAGAHLFFDSVFRKRILPPPSQVTRVDEDKEKEYMQPETATNAATSDATVPVGYGANCSSMPSDSNGVAELEDILKQKTFTRSEIDHLTALLLSRTVENSNGLEKKSESKPSELQVVSHLPAHELRIDHARTTAFSTPEVRTKVVPEDVASPAEIAKAYMGTMSAKLSPSVSRLQNQLPKDDLSTTSNPLSTSLSPLMSLTQKPVGDVGNSSRSLMTPKFRGRSAIYSMARTPYTRAYPVTSFKAPETSCNASGGSLYLDETQNHSSKKQVLKRRSSVLDNDIGSVGPIRRIRQKPNLLHPKTLSLPPPSGRQITHGSGMLSDVSEVPSSKMLSDSSLPGTSSGYVPSQSIEMAQKIFDQLDKISPKGTLGKNVVSVGKLPTKTPVKSPDSLKPLRSSQDVNNSIGSFDTAHARNHQSQTSSTVEEVGANKFVSMSANLGPQDAAEGQKAVSNSSRQGKAVDYVMPASVVDRPQKRAFQMSAHEDYLELDDDLPSNEVAFSTPLTEGRRHAESSTKSVAIPDILSRDQEIAVEKPPSTRTTTQLGKSEPDSLANGPSASPTNILDAPQAILVSDKVAPSNEISEFFTAPSSKLDKLSPVVHTSPSAAKDTKLETPNSAKRVLAEVNGPDKTDDKSTLLFGNTATKSEDPPSVGALSNGSQTNSSTAVNGVLSTVPANVNATWPASFTSVSINQSSIPASMSSPSPFSFSGVGAQPTFASSTSTPVTPSASNLSGSVTTPPFTFTSGFPSPSTGLSTSTSNATSSLLDAKPSALASGGNNISTFTAPTSKSTGGDVPTADPTSSNKLPFSFQTGGTSVLASTPSFSVQTAPSFSVQSAPSFSVQSASSFSSQIAPSLSGQFASSVPAPSSTSTLTFPGQSASSVSAPVSTSAPSFPVQSTASPSAFVFGSSGSTGSSSGSIFGSFSANPFSSGSGSNSLGSSFTNSSVSTSSSTTSSIFGFTSQSPKPTAGIVEPSPSPPVFSFGLGSSVATTSSPVFGATASSTATSNSTPFVFGGSAPVMTNPPFQSQAVFSNASSQPFAFGSNPSTNNDQNTMEDTMAEDSLQPSTPAAPAFGAQPPFGAPVAAPSSSVFGFNATPPAANPFQFNTQPTQIPPQNPSFQPSGSLEFNGGSNSFSVGTTTGDKSQRRMIKVKKGARRK